jgi:carbon-monoxide dehydrogenase large subunit
VNNRLVPNAIEPRSANASYSRAEDGYTLYVASQNPHVERLLMTAFVLGLPENKVRVVAPDVGGGFGSKIYLYPRTWSSPGRSKQLNRPVKWTSDRSEPSCPTRTGATTSPSRARARQERQVPRDARADHRQPRRVSLDVRLVHPDDPLRDAARGPVHHAAHLLRGHRGVHQHHAGGRLPRRRPAEATYVSSAGRNRGARAQARSGRDPAAQLHQDFPYQTPVALCYDTGNYEATLERRARLADVGGLQKRKKSR